MRNESAIIDRIPFPYTHYKTFELIYDKILRNHKFNSNLPLNDENDINQTILHFYRIVYTAATF